uniref:Uncharacterized protein LOC114326850 n=1 Tax=Diabrotica virgifera virgifera TaxID=50390 RepID=A0A6P7F5U7_DIAVI
MKSNHEFLDVPCQTLLYNMMIYYAIVWLTIWNWNTAAQQSSQFEDIPIEHYVHNDHQNDEIDVELMPRSPKLLSIAQNSNPDTNIDTHNRRHPYFEELTSQIIKSRSKRDITTERPITVLEKIGQPLELFTVDKENITDQYVNTSVIKKNKTENNLNGTLQINDFLRFRRALQTDLVKQQNSRGRYYDRYPSAQRDSYRDYPEYNRNYEPESSSGPNRRRIIYYATLPEITRISRDDDFRRPYDNYDYRNRYDERYAPPEHYAYRDRLYDDPRQENDPKDRRDPRYPLRVSTDVRVNDIRKNPERRIYSDVDRAKYVPTR